MHKMLYSNVWTAGDMAASREIRVGALEYIGALVHTEVQQPTPAADPPSVESTTANAPTSIPWACVAEAETGSDFTMHGPTYSTAYGIVNDIVYDYATPAVAARVFAGTASPEEQTDIVARFAADHGTDGWGELTKEKCGL